MGTSQRWSKTKKWAAWSGDRSDFLHLLEVVAEVSERLRDDFVADKTLSYANAVSTLQKKCRCDDENADQWHREDHARANAELEQAKASALDEPPLGLTVANLDGTVESMDGEPADVVRIVDERDSASITVAGAIFDYRSHLTIRMSQDNGVTLDVQSKNIEWAKVAFEDLSKLIGRGSRHAWVRNDLTLGVLATLAAAPVLYGFVVLIDNSIRPADPLGASDRVALSLWAALLASWPLIVFAKRFLVPGFELSRDGARAPSRTRAGWIFSSLAWGAGIAIPMLLNR